MKVATPFILVVLLFASLVANSQTLTALPASVAGFTTVVGTPSAAQSVVLNGTGLTGTVTATAPAGFEISWTSGSSYSTSVVLTQAGGVVSNVPLFVRLTGVATGAVSGTMSISSAGAPTQGVALTGAVTAAATPNPPCTLTSISPTSGPGGTVQTIRLFGRNFVPGVVVSLLVGSPISVTFISSNQLNVLMETPSIPSRYDFYFIVNNPLPGGGGGSFTSLIFTVNGAPPIITGFAPTSGPVGTTVVVSGTNLAPLSSGVSVFFNGVLGGSLPRLPQPREVYTVVPPGATTGLITVTNPNGAAVSAVPFTVTAPPPTFFEDFETGTKTSYAPASVALLSGGWTMAEALIGAAPGADKFNGTRSARLRGGGFVEMDTDKPNGAGVVTVSAAGYATELGASFVPELSTDGGVTYSSLLGNNPPPTLTGVLTPYSFLVNRPGNVRLRFSSTNTAPVSNPRFNLDDIGITDYRLGSAAVASVALPELTVYPNPAQGQVTVLGAGPGTVTADFYDLTGRRRASPSNVAADHLLPLPPLPPGLYLLRLGSTTGQRTVRLAIQ